jgi:hypothetical protein
MSRMQCAPAGTGRPWAMTKADRGRRCRRRASDVGEQTSPWPRFVPLPRAGMTRSIRTPGRRQRGPSCRACAGACGSVTPRNADCAIEVPCRSTTTAPVGDDLVSLDPSGKPSSSRPTTRRPAHEERGSGQQWLQPGVLLLMQPYFSRTSMLPVSGALQLKTKGRGTARSAQRWGRSRRWTTPSRHRSRTARHTDLVAGWEEEVPPGCGRGLQLGG